MRIGFGSTWRVPALPNLRNYILRRLPRLAPASFGRRYDVRCNSTAFGRVAAWSIDEDDQALSELSGASAARRRLRSDALLELSPSLLLVVLGQSFRML